MALVVLALAAAGAEAAPKGGKVAPRLPGGGSAERSTGSLESVELEKLSKQAASAWLGLHTCCQHLKFAAYKTCCVADLKSLGARRTKAHELAKSGQSAAAIQEYKQAVALAAKLQDDCARLKSAEKGYYLMKSRIASLSGELAAASKKPGLSAKTKGCLASRLASLKLAKAKLEPAPTVCGDKGDPHGYLLISETFWNQAKQPCP
jgi:hypothetical protein